MSPTLSGQRKESHTPVIECLAVRRRRELLGILVDRVPPVSERKLATELAAIEQEDSETDVTKEEIQTVHVELHHVHLPSLEDVGLIDWDRTEEVVTTTDHPALRDPQLQRIIETETGGWDAVIATLANRYRRIVVSVLADRDGPLSREELAREIVALDPSCDTGSDGQELLVPLHHVHLPKLADVGLVEYDVDAGTVSFEGNSELKAEWLEFTPDETHQDGSNSLLTFVQ